MKYLIGLALAVLAACNANDSAPTQAIIKDSVIVKDTVVQNQSCTIQGVLPAVSTGNITYGLGEWGVSIANKCSGIGAIGSASVYVRKDANYTWLTPAFGFNSMYVIIYDNTANGVFPATELIGYQYELVINP